jgi:hypothetical protein
VTATGEKRILGLVQTASENKRVIAAFLRELGDRGFPLDRLLLVVLDGAKGLRAAVREVFGDVPVQRCQWPKRENVVSYLAKHQQPAWRRKLAEAYGHAAYADAKRALERLHREPRSEDAPGDAVAHERSEIALVRFSPVGNGKTISPYQELSPSTLTQARPSEQTLAHELRCGVSRIHTWHRLNFN